MGVLKENMRMLQLIGFWVPNNSKRDLVFYLRRVLVYNVMVYAMYGLVFGMPMYMYHHLDNLSELSECLGNWAGTFLTTTLFLTLVFQNDQLTDMFHTLSEIGEMHRPNDDQAKEIDESTKRQCHFWSVIFPRVSYFMFLILAAIAGGDVVKNRDIERRLKLVYPFDVYQPGVFEFMVITFAVNLLEGSLMIMSGALLVICQYINILGQLKVLNHKLGSLRSSAESSVRAKWGHRFEPRLPPRVLPANRGQEARDRQLAGQVTARHALNQEVPVNQPARAWWNLVGAVEVEKQMQLSLKECIVHHNGIVDFMGKFESYWSAFFTANLIVCLAQSVLILTSAAMKSGNANLLVHFGIIASFYSMLGAICFLSQMVTLETELLQESIYGCGWTESSMALKRSVGIMISVTNQPIVIQAAKCIPLSLATFKSVLNSAYSFYMVLSSF